MLDLILRLEEATGLEWASKLKRAPNGCLEWQGARDGRGRGRRHVGGKLKLVSRIVWEVVNGPIPDGMLLCHHCDNGSCVDPEHVYVGTHADNTRDAVVRGRYFFAIDPERCRAAAKKAGQANTWAQGSGNPKAKLTDVQASAIRSDTRATRFVAAEYGVERTTIQRIRRGALWTN